MNHVTSAGLQVRRATVDAWDKEARALKAIKSLNQGSPHPHMIQYLGSMKRGEDRYFMFPWAGEGNLRQSWINIKKQVPQKAVVLEALSQLVGVADCLRLLHDPKSSIPGGEEAAGLTDPNRSIRHGDIKPENLLWFTTSDGRILKIADLGLAKQHLRKTKDRDIITTTHYGTIEYESPEVLMKAGPRSRLYDVWSMGCVIFEYILWMLYGYDGLEGFHNHLKQHCGENRQFFKKSRTGSPAGDFDVHPVVCHWIRCVRREHPECSNQRPSALKSLLDLVEHRLLVVTLPAESTGMNRGSGGLAGNDLSKSSRKSHDAPTQAMPRFSNNTTASRNRVLPSVRTSGASRNAQVGPAQRTGCRATAEELYTYLNDILTKAKQSGNYAVLCPGQRYTEPPSSTSESRIRSTRKPEQEIRVSPNLSGAKGMTN